MVGHSIGGSLRIPAHYSGCFGLKPCYGRYPTAGNRPRMFRLVVLNHTHILFQLSRGPKAL